MYGYDPMVSFGKATADRYDDTLRGDEAETVDLLLELARGGPVLELAIGTGRIALPLAERGLTVDGIDLSPEMIERLRMKPGGDRIEVTLGDFADVPVDKTYQLIYIVFNTFHNLLSQDDQVRCFENVASHLGDEGRFLIEAGVPSEYFGKTEMAYVNAETIEIDRVGLDVAQYDQATQLLTENHVVLTTEGIQFFPIVTRYAWPSELDLMARIAGLRLHNRWSGWFREPFTSRSWRHVSVFGR